MSNITVTTNQQVIEVTETGGVDVTNTTNDITVLTAGTLIIEDAAGTIVSVNGQTGPIVVLDTDDIPEGTNKYFSQALARQSLSAGTGISYDNSTGVITNTSINTDTTYTQNASAATGGANLNLVGSDSTTDTVKFASGTNITVSRTDANTITFDGTDTNTTYTIASGATTGGANLTLTGSDSSTDSVAYKGSGATTVTSTDANTITIASTDTNTTYTQNASSTTGGANLNLVGSDSTTDSIKLASGTNVTVTRTDADTVTISSTDTNTTYTQNISSTSGGANLNLVGSDSTTDTVKFADGTGVTVAYTDANTATISIGQSVGTGDSPSFAGGTFGNITVGVATDNTITTTSGDLILDSTSGTITVNSNGTLGVTLTPITGQSPNTTFTGNVVKGVVRDSTTLANGDMWSFLSGTGQGYRGISIDNSANTAKNPSAILRSFTGGAVAANPTTPRVIFERARGTSAIPTAIQSGDLLGNIAATGANGTGTWLGDTVGALPASITFSATENFTSNTNVGTGMSISLMPTAKTLASVATPTIVYQTNPQATTQRSDSFTWQTGNTSAVPGSTTTLALDVSGNLTTTGNLTVNGTGTSTIGGDLTVTNDLAVNGGDITTTQTTASVFNTTATTLNIGGAATLAANIGTANGSIVKGPNRFTSPTINAFQGSTSPSRGLSISNGNGGSAALARNALVLRTYPTAGGPRGQMLFENARGIENVPSALVNGDLIGETSASGYATNGWLSDYVVSTPAVAQFVATETWANTGGPYPTAGTVTNAGTGYQIALQPSATTVTASNGSRINVLNINPQVFNCRSDSYTWSNGKTGTTQRMSLDVSGNLSVSANISTQNGSISANGPFDSNQALGSTANLLSTNYDSGSSIGIQTNYWTDSTKTTLVIPQTNYKLGNFRFNSYQDTSGTYALGAQVISEATENWTSTANGSKIIFLANKQGQNWSTGHSGVASFAPEAANISSDTITFESSAGNNYLVLNGTTATLTNTAGNPLTGGQINYGRQYIEAYSTQDQTNPVASAENLMSFNNTGISNGISIVTNGTTLTRITMSTAGIYNIQFSAQLNQTTGGAHNAFIWLKKNGTAVADTAGDTRVAGNGDRIMAAWNYIVSAAAGDYYELAWAANDTNVVLDYTAAAAPIPAIPSVILTVVPVGA